MRKNTRSEIGTLESPPAEVHLAPSDQPTSVHQLTKRLFSAYTIDGGSVHLAGCTLEDRLFVKLKFRQDDEPFDFYLDDQGEPVADDRLETLGLLDTIELETPPALIDSVVAMIVERGTQLAANRSAGPEPPELIETIFLWCKFSEGKLCFTLGKQTTELRFAGWTRLIEPPPFVCPHTGDNSYHLSTLDDGRIVAAERVETCESTGRRCLTDELVTCAATGKRVVSELTTECPVMGEPVLRDQLIVCDVCGQEVSPTSIENQRCRACRTLSKINKDDPRMARLLSEHPHLNDWIRWQMSETERVYILSASGWLKRLLLVVDKETLQFHRIATSHRFSSTWQEKRGTGALN